MSNTNDYGTGLTAGTLTTSPTFALRDRPHMIGFNRILEIFENQLGIPDVNYPPYNLKQVGDSYEVTMAVAGFTADDIEVTLKQNQLSIKGEIHNEDGHADEVYLHRGLSSRKFRREFTLADHVKVKEVSLNDGLLKISLVYEVPEELKPRQIEIKTG